MYRLSGELKGSEVWGRISPKTQGKSKEDPNDPRPKTEATTRIVERTDRRRQRSVSRGSRKAANAAMQLEREEFLGARRWERSEQRRDHANGYKAKTLSTRVSFKSVFHKYVTWTSIPDPWSEGAVRRRP